MILFYMNDIRLIFALCEVIVPILSVSQPRVLRFCTEA